ncbi:MAG: hypothetical protein R3D59_17390 [Paracoccaceae bacterium]
MVAAMAAFAVEDALFKSVAASFLPGRRTLLFGLTGLAILALWSVAVRELGVRARWSVRGSPVRSKSRSAGGCSSPRARLRAAGDHFGDLRPRPSSSSPWPRCLAGTRVAASRWLAVGLGFVGKPPVIRPTPAEFDATAPSRSPRPSVLPVAISPRG